MDTCIGYRSFFNTLYFAPIKKHNTYKEASCI